MLNPLQVIKSLDFERLSGTAGEKKAVEIICTYLKEQGWTPEIEKFGLNTFDAGTAKLIIEGKEFSATPYGLNKDTEVEGELVWLDNAGMVAQNRGGYRNKIVMAYGYTRNIASKLKENGIKGYINVGKPGRNATSLSHRQATYKDGYVDSVMVSHEVGIKLKRYTGKKLKLVIKQKVYESQGHNIVVDIPGRGLDETLTIAGGHLDSVAHSPGASDNGGGIVTLLKIAERFKRNELKRDLRIVFFGGEELGLLGSQAYVKSHLEELKTRLGLMINIDVSGDAMGIDSVAVIGTKELLGYMDGLIKETGYMFQRRLDIYSSDSMPFSVHEFPSVNLARFGGKASQMIHTSGDNYRNVSRDGYTSCIKASIYLIQRILNAGVYPIDRKIDSSLREKIEKYIWALNFEAPKLEWEPNYK